MVDERLEEAIVRTGARLLILDPIQAYLGGGMDMNRANEARDMTKKLGALAEKTKCAIILIGHMNKASGNKAAYRGMGSIDFFAVARSVLLLCLLHFICLWCNAAKHLIHRNLIISNPLKAFL